MLLLLATLLSAAMPLYAQSDSLARNDSYIGRWSYDFSIGTAPGSRIIQPVAPSITLRHREGGGVIVGIGIKNYWSQHWGIQSQFTIGSGPQNQYEETGTTDIEDNGHSFVMNLSTGIVYRHDFRRLTLQPNLSIGIGITNERSQVIYYQKYAGSNDTDRIRLHRNGNAGFTINPGIYAGWRLNDRFHAFMEITYIISLYKYPPINGHITDAFDYSLKKEFVVEGKRQNLTFVKFGITYRQAKGATGTKRTRRSSKVLYL